MFLTLKACAKPSLMVTPPPFPGPFGAGLVLVSNTSAPPETLTSVHCLKVVTEVALESKPLAAKPTVNCALKLLRGSAVGG